MKNIKTKFRRVFTFILGIIFVISVTILADMIRSRMDNKKVTDIGVQADTSLASTVGNFPLRYSNYFIGNVTSTSGEYLMQIKAPAGASWSGLEITQGNSKYSSLYWTAPTKTVVSASNGTTWGQGVLDLWGNPVAANGKEISKKIQHKNVTIGNIQLDSTGKYDISNKRPSGMNNFLYTSILYYSSTSPKVSFSLAIALQDHYVIGTPNQTINGLQVTYYYTD